MVPFYSHYLFMACWLFVCLSLESGVCTCVFEHWYGSAYVSVQVCVRVSVVWVCECTCAGVCEGECVWVCVYICWIEGRGGQSRTAFASGMLFAKSHLFNCPPSKKDVAEYGSEPFEAKKLNAPGPGWMLTRSHLNQIGTKDFFLQNLLSSSKRSLIF